MTDQDNDTLSLSRLDVISCALGAAILLFLSLSAIRIQKPSETSATRFLHVSVDLVSGMDRRDSPVITFFVTPPGGQTPIDVPAFAFDPVSGRLRPEATALVSFTRLLEKGTFHVSGSAIEADRERREAPASAYLTITDPVPGEWLFQFAVTNSRDSFGTVLSGEAADLKVDGIIRALSRTSSSVKSVDSTVTVGRLSETVLMSVE